MIDPDIGFALLGMGELRFHSDARRPMGWWWGPRGEYGKSNSAGTTYTVYGGGLKGGSSWACFRSAAFGKPTNDRRVDIRAFVLPRGQRCRLDQT